MKLFERIADAWDILWNGKPEPIIIEEKPVKLSLEGFKRLSIGMKLVVIVGILLLMLLILYFGYSLFVYFSSDEINTITS